MYMNPRIHACAMCAKAHKKVLRVHHHRDLYTTYCQKDIIRLAEKRNKRHEIFGLTKGRFDAAVSQISKAVQNFEII